MPVTMLEKMVATPLPLADVKAYLRLEDSDEDSLLLTLTDTAAAHLERVAGLALLRQRRRLYCDHLPEDGRLSLDCAPVVSIVAVTLYDRDGHPTVRDGTGMSLDASSQPAIVRAPASLFASGAENGIDIDFLAGFGDLASAIPSELRQAMLLHIATMFACRSAFSGEQQPAAVPPGYDRLIAPYRAVRI